MSRHWHFCAGTEDTVKSVVRSRFAPPLYEPSTVDDATHTIELCGDVICEYGLGLAHSLLPARLAAATREPVISILGVQPRAIQTEPNGAVLSAELPIRPSPWRPTTTLHYAENPDERVALAVRYFHGVEAFIAGLFPIRTRLARLDCKRASACGGALNGHVECELQLAIYRAVGDDRELVELRSDSLELCRLRWPPGAAIDESITAFEKSMRRWVRALKQTLEDTIDWTGVTPRSLLGR